MTSGEPFSTEPEAALSALRGPHRIPRLGFAALIEEHERRQFWEAMDAIDPEEYEAQTRAEGAWPAEGEYAAEEQMIRAHETTA